MTPLSLFRQMPAAASLMAKRRMLTARIKSNDDRGQHELSPSGKFLWSRICHAAATS